jgi:hypothetical protein
MKDRKSTVLAALVGALSVGTPTAAAAMPRTGATSPLPSGLNEGCRVPLSQIQYSARFEWQGQRLQLRVGTIRRGDGRMQRVATISGAGSCQAVCTAKPLEKTDERRPIAMDLACWSSQLEALNSPVTIVWPNAERGTRANLLRFGTWVDGYREAALRVEFDHYSEAVTGPKLAAQQAAPQEIARAP